MHLLISELFDLFQYTIYIDYTSLIVSKGGELLPITLLVLDCANKTFFFEASPSHFL